MIFLALPLLYLLACVVTPVLWMLWHLASFLEVVRTQFGSGPSLLIMALLAADVILFWNTKPFWFFHVPLAVGVCLLF